MFVYDNSSKKSFDIALYGKSTKKSNGTSFYSTKFAGFLDSNRDKKLLIMVNTNVNRTQTIIDPRGLDQYRI